MKSHLRNAVTRSLENKGYTNLVGVIIVLRNRIPVYTLAIPLKQLLTSSKKLNISHEREIKGEV